MLRPDALTVVVNVGDDTERYGVHVAADLDTVMYTLAGVEGPQGWGRADDTFSTLKGLETLGVDTTFQLGDADLALCLLRTDLLARGWPLSDVTTELSHQLGIDDVTVIPPTNSAVRTWVETAHEGWLDFQTYFVDRRHTDEVRSIAYHGAVEAEPAPDVVERIQSADVVVIAPSNPPLSIWPILAIEDIAAAVAEHPCVVGVSPLFSGKPLKGPADEVMRAVGLSEGTLGVLEAYRGLLDALVIDMADAEDVGLGDAFSVDVITADTRLGPPGDGRACVAAVLGWEPS